MSVFTGSVNQSLWLATTPKTSFPSLASGLHVDVAIVGGGIAGIMTAYYLKQQGKTVAVIEADRIATKTTGHTTAHLSIAHELTYDYLLTNFGKEAARLYAEANQFGIDAINHISQAENIDCDFLYTNEYIFTPPQMDTGPLQKEYYALKKLNIEANYLQAAPAPFKEASAIEYTRQARFHPRKFLLGLTEKIAGSGSYIFENTRVVDVHENEPMEVETNQGKLTANDVVIATLFPFLDRGLYFARLGVHTSYVIAVKVADDFPEAMFDSTEAHSHYLRRQPYEDGYLVLVGGEGHPTGKVRDTKEHYRQLADYARRHLQVESIVYQWSTHDTYPHDQVPYIGKFLPTSKHLFVATGFLGWGMAHGVVAGRLLTDLITNISNPWASLYNPGRFKPNASAKETLKQNLQVGKMYIGSKLSRKPELNLSGLKPGEGVIFEIEKEKVAVYKDETGETHAVSARCQHLGCTVNFNSAEKTWDCPCHGSRYDTDGKMLNGPTVKDLPK